MSPRSRKGGTGDFDGASPSGNTEKSPLGPLFSKGGRNALAQRMKRRTITAVIAGASAHNRANPADTAVEAPLPRSNW